MDALVYYAAIMSGRVAASMTDPFTIAMAVSVLLIAIVWNSAASALFVAASMYAMHVAAMWDYWGALNIRHAAPWRVLSAYVIIAAMSFGMGRMMALIYRSVRK